MINIELLKEELEAAGVKYYGASLNRDGLLYVSFLTKNRDEKRKPTAVELAAIAAVVNRHDPTKPERKEREKQKAHLAVSGAVGKNVSVLSLPEVRALFAMVLFKFGAIDENGIVLPPADWD